VNGHIAEAPRFLGRVCFLPRDAGVGAGRPLTECRPHGPLPAKAAAVSRRKVCLRARAGAGRGNGARRCAPFPLPVIAS
jgi:hypothetical protein